MENLGAWIMGRNMFGPCEALLAGIDLPALGYTVSAQVAGERATHVVLTKGS